MSWSATPQYDDGIVPRSTALTVSAVTVIPIDGDTPTTGTISAVAGIIARPTTGLLWPRPPSRAS